MRRLLLFPKKIRKKVDLLITRSCMLDFGLAELLMIAVVAVLVIGPNEIPKVMIALGRVFRRIQYVKYAFSQQFEDVMRDADLSDIRKQVNFEEKDFDEEEADAEYLASLESDAEVRDE